MMQRIIFVVALLVAQQLTACLQSPIVECSNGKFCPSPNRCIEVSLQSTICATPNAIADCADQAVGATCVDNQGFCTTTLDGLVCIASVCGDGLRTGNEVCDDGNLSSGDGCSRDCGSNETCGNGRVDGIADEQCDDGIIGLSGDRCSSECKQELDTWRNLTPVPDVPPGSRIEVSTAFDSRRGVLVFYGGRIVTNNDTWEWNGSSWRQRCISPSCQSTPAPTDVAMAYDPIRSKIMVVSNNEAWDFDGDSWQRTSQNIQPSVDFVQRRSMQFDPARGAMFLFGGVGVVSVADVWKFEANQWRLQPVKLPVALTKPVVAFDAGRQRVVLFGGETRLQFSQLIPNLNTYEFDGTTFTQIASNLPFDPNEATAAFDPISNRVIALDARFDTWELAPDPTKPRGAVWRQRTPVVSPNNIILPSMQYDTIHHNLLVVGTAARKIELWNYGFVSASSPPDDCIAGTDSDHDGLIACGDGTDPTNVTHGADPDCFSRCFPECPLPLAGTSALCDPTKPRCGDNVCNPFFEDATLCPKDCN
jgi:cysteine-rich repeat protein